MKLATIAAITLGALGAGSAPAFAATEVPVFDGNLKFVALNQVCLDDGWRVGESFSLVFRSAVRPSNKRGGGIQLLTSRLAFSMVLPDRKPLLGGRRTGKFQVVGMSGQVGPYSYPSSFDLTISPTNISSATKSVRISGTLQGFSGVPGCIVTVSGSAKLRP